MSTVYILHSLKLDRFYIGETTLNVVDRLNKHNTGYYGKKSFTSTADDWLLKLEMKCLDRSHALRLEKKIKSMKSRKYIENLLKYEEMRCRVINETKD
jgi:putative endonuclease